MRNGTGGGPIACRGLVSSIDRPLEGGRSTNGGGFILSAVAVLERGAGTGGLKKEISTMSLFWHFDVLRLVTAAVEFI